MGRAAGADGARLPAALRGLSGWPWGWQRGVHPCLVSWCRRGCVSIPTLQGSSAGDSVFQQLNSFGCCGVMGAPQRLKNEEQTAETKGFLSPSQQRQPVICLIRAFVTLRFHSFWCSVSVCCVGVVGLSVGSAASVAFQVRLTQVLMGNNAIISAGQCQTL